MTRPAVSSTVCSLMSFLNDSQLIRNTITSILLHSTHTAVGRWKYLYDIDFRIRISLPFTPLLHPMIHTTNRSVFSSAITLNMSSVIEDDGGFETGQRKIGNGYMFSTPKRTELWIEIQCSMRHLWQEFVINVDDAQRLANENLLHLHWSNHVTHLPYRKHASDSFIGHCQKYVCLQATNSICRSIKFITLRVGRWWLQIRILKIRDEFCVTWLAFWLPFKYKFKLITANRILRIYMNVLCHVSM